MGVIESSVSASALPGGFHAPVLLAEVLELFELARQGKPEPRIIDCTLGAGGHSLALLEAAPEARLHAFDADPEALARAGSRLERFSGRFEATESFFDEGLRLLASDPETPRADFVLFDLGLSMHQLKGSNRGFSFSSDEPLDMRMSPSIDENAADLIARLREDELADLIFRFGEERLSRRIAKAICDARKRSRIAGTAALASIIASAVPPSYRHGRIHPATRSFQALRIAVNDELGRVERALPLAAGLLSEGGVLAVIAFHSLEDRISKRFCRSMGTAGYTELFRTPRQPQEEELHANPASRSAKLRALRRNGVEEIQPPSYKRGRKAGL